MRNAIIVALVLVAAFVVWPTPWRYEHACTRLVRINRFTSTSDVLLDNGWYRLKPNPFDDMVRQQESERLGRIVTSTLLCPAHK